LLCWLAGFALAEKIITVAQDGSGDLKHLFRTPSTPAAGKQSDRTLIRIKAGTYHGPIIVRKTVRKSLSRVKARTKPS
jgi:hypothetical protein